ncbi:MAG: PcfJ domain-containing protein [Lachnospiraceae bacterium]|nr:PcfJ domain-containing protein [Lachnospiraceae bacterium]
MKIQDYILNETELKELNEKKTRKKKYKKQAKAEYRILFQDNCDFGIEKTQEGEKSELIILVSQNQYYIREKGMVKKATIRPARKFLSDLDEPLELKDVSWITYLDRSTLHYDIFFEFGLLGVREFMMKGLFYVYSPNERSGFDGGTGGELDLHCIAARIHINNAFEVPVITLFEKVINIIAGKRSVSKKDVFAKILNDPCGKRETALLKSFDTLVLIAGLYGMEWAVYYVERYMESTIECEICVDDIINVLELGLYGKELTLKGFYNQYIFDAFDELPDKFSDLNNEESPASSITVDDYIKEFTERRKKRLKKVKNTLIFKPEHFIEYLIFHPVREGYADDPARFFSDWTEYLEEQIAVYGKIRDKYPGYLASSLMLIKYKKRLHEQELNEKLWEESVERMKKLEYAADDYTIIAPKGKEDISIEAREQHNCLLGYTDKVTRGEEMIMFLRKKEHPDESLVTIEVMPDGNIGQIFRAFNQSPDSTEMAFIREWAGKMNLKMPEMPIPPRAV